MEAEEEDAPEMERLAEAEMQAKAEAEIMAAVEEEAAVTAAEAAVALAPLRRAIPEAAEEEAAAKSRFSASFSRV